MTNDINQQDHDEIMSLLPWFANKTLDNEQHAIVLAHIDQCEECQHELEFFSSMKETIQSDAQSSYLQHASVNSDLQNVLTRIDAGEAESKAASNDTSFIKQTLRKMGDYLLTLPVGVQGATAVACVLVALVGFQAFQSASDDAYSVLSSSDMNENSIRLSVEVDAATDRAQAQLSIQNTFDDQSRKAEIEEGSNGNYIVVVSDDLDVDELNSLVNNLTDQTFVNRVEILP